MLRLSSPYLDLNVLSSVPSHSDVSFVASLGASLMSLSIQSYGTIASAVSFLNSCPVEHVRGVHCQAV